MLKITALKSKLLPLFILSTFALSFPTQAFALTWEQVGGDGLGNPSNVLNVRFGIFQNNLYAGMSNENGAELYKSSDGSTWNQVTSFSTDGVYLLDFEEFNGYFYASTGGELNFEPQGAPQPATSKILRSPDGNTWENVVTNGFDDENNDLIFTLEKFGNYLYATTQNLITGGEIWQTSDGTTWTQVGGDGLGDFNNFVIIPLTVFNNYLYAGVGNEITGAEIYRSADGQTWNQISGLGNLNNLAITEFFIYKGELFAGAYNINEEGAEIYKTTDGQSWSSVSGGGFGDVANEYPTFQPSIVNNLVYFGTELVGGGARLYKTDTATFTQEGTDGFGDSNNIALYALTFFNKRLYAGFSNLTTGVEIWRSEELPTLNLTVEGQSGQNIVLPNGTASTTYSTQLTASFGTSPYTFTLESGSLPPGLSLSGSGLISGTIAHASSYSFTVKITDSGFPAQTYSQSLTIEVSPAATLEVSPAATLPETGLEAKTDNSPIYYVLAIVFGIALYPVSLKLINRFKKLKRYFFGLRIITILLAGTVLSALINVSTAETKSQTSNTPTQKQVVAIAQPPEKKDPWFEQRFQRFGLTIDKLNFKVPITEGIDGANEANYEKPLLAGLGQYQGTSLPGQGGNIFLFGHSVNTAGASTFYGRDFAKISELESGDQITLVKNGKNFDYRVDEKKVVEETDLSVLQPTNQEVVTLMTCFPAGKSNQRLIVRASLI